MADEQFRVVIPARYASTRFPGKALAELHGRPIIRHVYEQAVSSRAREVIIATDDRRIADVAGQFGADVTMTRSDHVSGTDRIAEVAADRGWEDRDIVVNVQGDAPLISGASIDQVAMLLADHPSSAIGTLCAAARADMEIDDPNLVKVVFDRQGRALYFSRSRIPAIAHGGEAPGNYWWHIGLYAYRAGALKALSATPVCALEQAEKLEQLRALDAGMEIRIATAAADLGPDINTPEDLQAAEQFMSEQRKS